MVITPCAGACTERCSRDAELCVCYIVLRLTTDDTSMGSTLTIRLDDELDRELARLAEQTGRTKSDVAREALRRQLSIQRFRALRAAAMPDAAAAGYLTDEDIFRDVS